MTQNRHIFIGAVGERYAARYLSQKGYRILAQNYRKPWGEADIIASKEGVVVLVEVKTNSREMAGFEPELRVNHAKQVRMERIARTFLIEYRLGEETLWQMDVVAVTLDLKHKVAKIRHYKNIE
ncbi:MAG TPA: YraN family protein [Candidatus Paceibacterota bacterium]|nr:YraN family protein [Candidatus Paceibacterota bacterium]